MYMEEYLYVTVVNDTGTTLRTHYDSAVRII